MLRILPDVDDVTTYLVAEDFGPLGRAILETDLAQADRETIVQNFIAGEYSSALRVVAFNTAEGWSRDVSEDIAAAIVDRAYAASEPLTGGTRRFVDRHLGMERRPPAPSTRPERVDAKRPA